GEVVDVLDERDALLATDIERRDGAGEEDRVADRQHGQVVAEDDLLVGARRHRRGVLLLGHVGLLAPAFRRAAPTRGDGNRLRLTWQTASIDFGPRTGRVKGPRDLWRS